MLFEIENPYMDMMLKNEEDVLAMTESMLVYAFESGLLPTGIGRYHSSPSD